MSDDDEGVYRYAPQLLKDWLEPQLPQAWVCTKIPADRDKPPINGRPIVQIDTVPAGPPPNEVQSWRRLIFTIIHDDEVTGGNLSELVRSKVFHAWRKNMGIYATEMVGEPARMDLPDDRIPRFQFTIDVLLRERYPAQQAAAGNSHNQLKGVDSQ